MLSPQSMKLHNPKVGSISPTADPGNSSVGSDTTGTSNTTRFNRKIDALTGINAALISSENADLSPRILSSPSTKRNLQYRPSSISQKSILSPSSPRQLPALPNRKIVGRAEFPSLPKINRDSIVEQYSVFATRGVRVSDRTGSAMLTYNPEYVRAVREISPGSHYPERCEYFSKLQNERAKGGPMSAFTAMLLEQHRIEEEKRRVREAEEERIRKVKMMFLRQMMGPAAEVIGAWREHVSKMKRVRLFIKKHVMGPASACLTAWIKYFRDMKKARAFMMKFMVGALRNTYAALKKYWMQQKRVKKLILGNLFGMKGTVFKAWAGTTSRSQKALRMFKAAMSDCMQYNFGKWKQLTEKNKGLKKMLLGHLVTSKRQMFMGWADVTQKTIRLRRLVSKIMHGFELSILMAWREASIMQRKSRIQSKLSESRAVGTSAFFCREELLASSPFPFEPIVKGTHVTLLGLREGWAQLRLQVKVLVEDRRGRKTTKIKFNEEKVWAEGLIGTKGIVSAFSAESGYCSVILDDDGYRGPGWELCKLKLDNVQSLDRSAAANNRLAKRGGIFDVTNKEDDEGSSEEDDVKVSNKLLEIASESQNSDSDSDTEIDFTYNPIKRKPPKDIPQEILPDIVDKACENFDVIAYVQDAFKIVLSDLCGDESEPLNVMPKKEIRFDFYGGADEEEEEAKRQEEQEQAIPTNQNETRVQQAENETEIEGETFMIGMSVFSVIEAENVARMIQGKFRQMVARRTVAARRAEKKQQDDAAAKMQAIARRRKAKKRVDEMTVHSRGKWQSEFDQNFGLHDEENLGSKASKTLLDDIAHAPVTFGVAHADHALNHERPSEGFHW